MTLHEIPLFIVYPGPVFGWAVACKGSAQRPFFSDKKVAITDARSCAGANRPARVRVETKADKIPAEWLYEPYRKDRH